MSENTQQLQEGAASDGLRRHAVSQQRRGKEVCLPSLLPVYLFVCSFIVALGVVPRYNTRYMVGKRFPTELNSLHSVFLYRVSLRCLDWP